MQRTATAPIAPAHRSSHTVGLLPRYSPQLFPKNLAVVGKIEYYCRCRIIHETPAFDGPYSTARHTGRVMSRIHQVAAIFGLLSSCVSPGLSATIVPTASGNGPDDFNTSTLLGAADSIITTKKFMDQAQAATPAFSDWIFEFNTDPTMIVNNNELVVNTYAAWAVTDTSFKAPDGRSFSHDISNEDAGGAHFVLTYNQKDSGHPQAQDVHFLQIFKQSINGGSPTYGIDNPGGTDLPFYDAGGFSRIGSTTSWILDDPARCEEGIGVVDGRGRCTHIQDELVTNASITFETYLVQDSVSNPHDVILYGGREWGYQYTAVDTPEPSFRLLVGILLACLIGYRRLHGAAVKR
jgi:hypothetical protein